jgi:hypothetical protein
MGGMQRKMQETRVEKLTEWSEVCERWDKVADCREGLKSSVSPGLNRVDWAW